MKRRTEVWKKFETKTKSYSDIETKGNERGLRVKKIEAAFNLRLLMS